MTVTVVTEPLLTVAVAAAPEPSLPPAPTPLMKEEGYGQGYQYAHDMPDRVAADMQCLPDSLAGREYYHPVDAGLEAQFRARLAELRRKKNV